eukprot:1904848-Pyramimonas_sp.AAC.1
MGDQGNQSLMYGREGPRSLVRISEVSAPTAWWRTGPGEAVQASSGPSFETIGAADVWAWRVSPK